MKTVWKMANHMNIGCEAKNRIFVGLLILINCIVGALLWGLIGRLYLPGVEWLLCFIGYPAVFIGFFGGMIYLYNHEFNTTKDDCGLNN